MKSFVCLLEKYWVGSKVLVLFSYKIICHLCHCWIYCVVCRWLTTIIHRIYAFLHCRPIACQMSKGGNIKNQKVPCFCSYFMSSSTGPEKEPDALRKSPSKHKSAPQSKGSDRNWPLSVTQSQGQGSWGWDPWKAAWQARQADGGLEGSRMLTKMEWKWWQQLELPFSPWSLSRFFLRILWHPQFCHGNVFLQGTGLKLHRSHRSGVRWYQSPWSMPKV